MPDVAETIFCPHCSVEIPSEVSVCPHCQGQVGSAEKVAEKRDSVYKYLDKPIYMLALLFCVTAGLGLPFLWKSKAFGPVGKWVLTVIMVIYTAVILYAIGVLLIGIGERCYEMFQVLTTP